jgi:hypothetical protein
MPTPEPSLPEEVRERTTTPRSLRDRVMPVLLVAGAAVAAFLLVPEVPHAHEVALRLQDPVTVTGLEVAWAPAGANPGDAVRGGSWRFAPGQAPAKVDTHVSLPDGRYELQVLVERGDERETLRKTLTLGGADHITVPLH